MTHLAKCSYSPTSKTFSWTLLDPSTQSTQEVSTVGRWYYLYKGGFLPVAPLIVGTWGGSFHGTRKGIHFPKGFHVNL